MQNGGIISKLTRTILFAAMGIILALSAYRYATYHFIDFDEAYNLQIAQSLAKNFCYCTTYEPRSVFPANISTHGVPQYVGAIIFAATHNPDAVVAYTAMLGTAALVGALLFWEPWLIAVTCLLFGTWTSYFVASVGFAGEVWAISFAITGIAFLKRHLSRPQKFDIIGRVSALFRDPDAIAAILFFGLAMECKLLIAAAIFPLAFAVLAKKSHDRPGSNILGAAIASATVFLAALIVLSLSISLSVVHSTRNPFDIGGMIGAFTGFVGNMIGQGSGQAGHIDSFIERLTSFSDPLALALFGVACAVLIRASVAYLPFIATTLVLFFGLGRPELERHLLMSLYLTIIIGAMEANIMLRRFAVDGIPMRTYAIAASSAFIVFLALNRMIGQPFYGAELEQQARVSHEQNHVISTSVNPSMHYTHRLVNAIRQEPFIVTSGWWQFPQLSIHEGLHFYDRMSTTNALLPKKKVALLFDEMNKSWPVTSRRANCGKLLYVEGPVVLCRPRSNLALNYQGPGL